MTEESTTEAMMGLRGELAALQYKRDRLLAELNDMRNQVRCKEQRASEIENESELLREQAARQTAVIATLKHRNQDLEEKDRNLSAELSRTESALNSLQLEHRAQDERVKVLERRVRDLETECHEEEQTKLAIRSAIADHVRRLATALGEPDPSDPYMSQDCLLHKASDLVQLVSRLRSRMPTTINELPIEMLEKIMSHLSESDRKMCRQVCRIWYDASYSASLVKADITTVKSMQDLNSFRTTSRHFHVEVEGFHDAILKAQYSSIFWTIHGETIRSLTLEDVDIEHPALAELLQNCQNLKTLKLTGCRYSSQEDKSWKASLENMALPTLREIQINAISVEAGNLIDVLMKKAQGLRRLCVSRVFCKDDDKIHNVGQPFSWQTLTATIERHSTTIKELEITKSCLTVDILLSIVNAIDPKLISLNLDQIEGKCMGAQTMQSGYTAVSQKLINLKAIYLNYSKIDQYTTNSILNKLHKLEDVNLRALKFPDQGPFLNYSNITSLDLGECEDIPRSYLIDALGSEVRPKFFFLGLDGIECVDDALLKQICPKLPNLEIFRVSESYVGDEGLETICRYNKKMVFLEMTCCLITRLSGDNWSINDLKELISLEIYYCEDFDATSIRMLRLPDLKWLYFSYSQVSPSDFETMLDGCPSLKCTDHIKSHESLYNVFRRKRFVTYR